MRNSHKLRSGGYPWATQLFLTLPHPLNVYFSAADEDDPGQPFCEAEESSHAIPFAADIKHHRPPEVIPNRVLA